MALEALGTIDSNALGQLITSHASTNTKGTYAQLIASTSITAKWLILNVSSTSDTSTRLIDIATGAVAAEVVQIADILLSGCTSGSTGAFMTTYHFPISIASGTRIACRLQGNEGSDVIRVKGWVAEAPTNQLQDMTRRTTYGATTADSGGIEVDPDGTPGTKGDYHEITSSTTNPIDWLYVCFGLKGNTAASSAGFMVDIATGAAASESIIIPDIYLLADTNEALVPTICGPFPVATIAAGTRLAARATSTINDATDRLIDVSIIGLDGTTAAGGGGAHFSAAFSG